MGFLYVKSFNLINRIEFWKLCRLYCGLRLVVCFWCGWVGRVLVKLLLLGVLDGYWKFIVVRVKDNKGIVIIYFGSFFLGRIFEGFNVLEFILY